MTPETFITLWEGTPIRRKKKEVIQIDDTSTGKTGTPKKGSTLPPSRSESEKEESDQSDAGDMDEDQEGAKSAEETTGGVSMEIDKAPEPEVPVQVGQSYTFNSEDEDRGYTSETTPTKERRSKRTQDIDIPTSKEVQARKRPPISSPPAPKRPKPSTPPEPLHIENADEDEDEDEDEEEVQKPTTPRKRPPPKRQKVNPTKSRSTATSIRAAQPALPPTLSEANPADVDDLLSAIFRHTSQIDDTRAKIDKISEFIDKWEKRHEDIAQRRLRIIDWVNSMSTSDQHRRMSLQAPSATPKALVDGCIKQIEELNPGLLDDADRNVVRKVIGMPLQGFSEALANIYSADDDTTLGQIGIDEIAARVFKLELFITRITQVTVDIQQGMVTLLGRDSDEPGVQPGRQRGRLEELFADLLAKYKSTNLEATEKLLKPMLQQIFDGTQQHYSTIREVVSALHQRHGELRMFLQAVLVHLTIGGPPLQVDSDIFVGNFAAYMKDLKEALSRRQNMEAKARTKPTGKKAPISAFSQDVDAGSEQGEIPESEEPLDTGPSEPIKTPEAPITGTKPIPEPKEISAPAT
ncbi:MAG: hypothetical protein AAFY74_20550, partial [Pseudomonadota bacterium]